MSNRWTFMFVEAGEHCGLQLLSNDGCLRVSIRVKRHLCCSTMGLCGYWGGCLSMGLGRHLHL